MARQIVYQDKEIKLIREGELYTDGLIACFGILGYFERGDKALLAMGHHSSSLLADILPKWYNFKQEHPELQVYDTGRILVAKMNPEPKMPNQWEQADGRILTYNQRLEELLRGLKVQHPRAVVEPIDYSTGSYFKANLDDLTWETNNSRGSLKP